MKKYNNDISQEKDLKHILISSTTNLKNFFLGMDKENLGDLSDTKMNDMLNSSQTNSGFSNMIFDKVKKKFYQKNLLEIIDTIYLSSKNISLNKSNETDKKIEDGTFYFDTKSPKYSVNDFNLKINIGGNFLNEKLYANKFNFENEKLKDTQNDHKINKFVRKIRYIMNDQQFNECEIFCVVYKDKDFKTVENNLKMINADFLHINKSK